MKLRSTISLCSAALLFLGAASFSSAATADGATKPNVIVILVDDMGWMEHEEITIAEALKPAGYGSGYIGKWHLGDPDWYPPGQGYEENRGGCDYGQPPSYFDPFNQPKGRHEMLRAGIPGLPGKRKGQYLTHREADEAEATGNSSSSGRATTSSTTSRTISASRTTSPRRCRRRRTPSTPSW